VLKVPFCSTISGYDEVVSTDCECFLMRECRNCALCIAAFKVHLSVQVHRSREGGVFKSRLTAMRGELLKSPYLIELGALHLNLADAKENTSSVTELVGEFSCDPENSTPTLSCKLLESGTLDFDLTCSICLVSTFSLYGFPFTRLGNIRAVTQGIVSLCPSYLYTFMILCSISIMSHVICLVITGNSV